MNELIKWLQENQLEKYADVLKQNDIESIDFKQLTQLKLSSLIISTYF
jgi:hypothetical protein